MTRTDAVHGAYVQCTLLQCTGRKKYCLFMLAKCLNVQINISISMCTVLHMDTKDSDAIVVIRNQVNFICLLSTKQEIIKTE